MEKKFSEVKTCWDEKEANSLLSDGKWELQHASVAHRGNGGFQAKPCFILAKIKPELKSKEKL